MRRIAILIVLLLCFSPVAMGAYRFSTIGDVGSKGASGYDPRAYNAADNGSTDAEPEFAAAITAAAGGTVIVTEAATSYKLSSNVTVPAGTTIKFQEGGTLSIDSGVTFTVNGTLEAGLYQIFSGAGTAVLAAGSSERVLPQWWGALGDNSNDDTAAVQAAIDAAEAANGGMVYFAPGDYKLTSTLILDSDRVQLVGAGFSSTLLRATQTDGTNLLEISDGPNNYCSVRDMAIVGNASSGDGILISAPSVNYGELKNLRLINNGGNGLRMEGGAYYWHIEHIQSVTNGGHGFYIVDTGGLQPNANTFMSCKGISNTGDGFHIEKGAGNLIIGGSFEGNTGWGIQTGVDTTANNQFTGFWVEGNTAGSIKTGVNSDDVFIPARLSGTPDAIYARKFDYTPRTPTAIVNNILGSAWAPWMIGNLRAGFGGLLTIPSFQMGKSGFASVETDSYGFYGKTMKLDVADDTCSLVAFRSPDEIPVGNYRAFFYGKSDSGTATVIFRVKNVTDNVTLGWVNNSVVPASADLYGILPVGGVPFTVDETENGDLLSFVVNKLAGFDGDDVYVSHVVIVPIEDVEFAFADFVADDATPSVLTGTRFKTTNINPTTITMFDDGYDGKEIVVEINDANTTFDFTSTNLKGNRGVDWVAVSGDYLVAFFNGTNWYCSINSPTLLKDITASGTGMSGGANDVLLGADADVTITLATSKDIVASGTGMSGGENDVLPGADADTTITLTTDKDIVAGTGLSGGENDVLPGADADTTINIDTTWSATFATLDTGEGANELFDMDQNVLVASSPTFVQVTLSGGIVKLAEITTPGADANYGKVYTKTDNDLYFQDGDGTEHTILKGATGIEHTYVAPLEDPTNEVGNWDVVQIGSSQKVHFAFQVPEDFESLTAVTVIVIPDATETIQWDILVSVAANGEEHDNDDRTALDETLSVTLDVLTELDISGVLTGLAAGDYVGIDFQSDTANIRVVGCEFDYN